MMSLGEPMAEDSTASSTHSGDLSLSYSSSSFESGSSQSSEDIGRHSVEPYLFEPESSDSSLSEGEASNAGDDSRLHDTNW